MFWGFGGFFLVYQSIRGVVFLFFFFFGGQRYMEGIEKIKKCKTFKDFFVFYFSQLFELSPEVYIE